MVNLAFRFERIASMKIISIYIHLNNIFSRWKFFFDKYLHKSEKTANSFFLFFGREGKEVYITRSCCSSFKVNLNCFLVARWREIVLCWKRSLRKRENYKPWKLKLKRDNAKNPPCFSSHFTPIVIYSACQTSQNSNVDTSFAHVEESLKLFLDGLLNR